METYILDFINYILDKNVLVVYIVFFASCILQLVFPPFPSDVILVFAGYTTTVSHSFDFVLILLNAMTGTFIGSVLVYEFGSRKGSKVLDYKIVKKFVHDKHRRRAEKTFQKYGSFAIVISKFVPGINAIMLLFSGIFKVKPRIVYVSILISVLIHHILVLLLGRFLGHNLKHVEKILKTYNGIAISLLALVLIGAATFYIVRRCKKVKVNNN